MSIQFRKSSDQHGDTVQHTLFWNAMCPTGLTQTLNVQIKSTQNQVLNFKLHCKMCCPFYSLIFIHMHLETYGFVYSPSRPELDFIHRSPSHIWAHVSLIRSLTHHFGDVNLGFCCTSPPLTEFRAHRTEQNQQQPCHRGYLLAQPCYFQHPIAQNLCNLTKQIYIYIYIFVDTNPTLQFKEMQTHLRCICVWLPALKLCDCIPARHGWNIALTGVRQLHMR